MLILRYMSKLAIDAVSKGSVVFKILLWKILKFGLYYWVFCFRATIIQMLFLNHYSIEKWGSKKDAIGLFGSINFEIIFILLAKVVVV